MNFQVDYPLPLEDPWIPPLRKVLPHICIYLINISPSTNSWSKWSCFTMSQLEPPEAQSGPALSATCPSIKSYLSFILEFPRHSNNQWYCDATFSSAFSFLEALGMDFLHLDSVVGGGSYGDLLWEPPFLLLDFFLLVILHEAWFLLAILMCLCLPCHVTAS